MYHAAPSANAQTIADADPELFGANLSAMAREVAARAREHGQADDADGAFPVEEIRQLQKTGLLRAPFPAAMGGCGLGIGQKGAAALLEVLVALGGGSLALGRLYEGHVNAIVLATRYGSDANLKLLLDEADAGRLSGVWMAGAPLRFDPKSARRTLVGSKILASGAGHVHRPLIAVELASGKSVMAIPQVAGGGRADCARWLTHGMRATATGTVDFTGISIDADEIVGGHDDYMRSPFFYGGAWRVLAVQLGGLTTILELYRSQLSESPYRDHPIQLARFGEAVIACETARLWVNEACRRAESPCDDPAAVDAYVDLARNAFEAVALRVIVLAQKAVGLKAFMRENPMERVARDLSPYLRQPALDVSLMSAASFHLERGRT